MAMMEHCMFQNWYPQFRSITFRSDIVPLSEDFIRYLNADGIYMPSSAFPKYEKEESESDNAWEDESGDAADEETDNSPNFPDLEMKIKEIIEKHEGAVFPKLNWSSPKDATWMSATGTLKCQNPYDIFLLLKSSDFINHDLSQLPPDQFVLVLRKWYNLNVSMEFRCFVKNGALIGISQRDHATFYEFLLEMKESLREKIVEFFETKISGKFPSENYTFDVYISQKGKVWLVDFDPWVETTEPLLFDWDELSLFGEHKEPVNPSQQESEGADNDVESDDASDDDDEWPIFRVVTSQSAMRPTLAMTNRIPSDLVDLSNSSAIADFCRNFGKVNAEDGPAACHEFSQADRVKRFSCRKGN